MKSSSLSVVVLALFSWTSFASADVGTSSAHAVIRGTIRDPNAVGFIRFDRKPGSDLFEVAVHVQNLTINANGKHAVHIHAWGDVMDPLGESSGEVLNPFDAPYGCPENGGARPLGNLGNWQARDGSIRESKLLDIVDIKYIAGRMAVIHSGEDDCASADDLGVRVAQGIVGVHNTEAKQDSEFSFAEIAKIPSKYLLSTSFGKMVERHVRVFEQHMLKDLALCDDVTGPLWAALGSSLGIAFANAGAAYGLAASFYGYISLGMTPRVDRLMLVKGLVPGIMASVRGVYGLIISILITVNLKEEGYSTMRGFAHLWAGICVGLTGVASGYCMGVIGNYGLRAVGKKAKLYINILLIIIFCEAIGLYGLIIGLILINQGPSSC